MEDGVRGLGFVLRNKRYVRPRTGSGINLRARVLLPNADGVVRGTRSFGRGDVCREVWAQRLTSGQRRVRLRGYGRVALPRGAVRSLSGAGACRCRCRKSGRTLGAVDGDDDDDDDELTKERRRR